MAAGDPPEATTETMTEPLALATSSARRATLAATASGLRGLTLDSDVTSLLRREVSAAAQPDAAGGSSPVPLQDRKANVQIVRGTDSRAVSLGAIELMPDQPVATPPSAD
jgi:hypothetical protein